MQKFVGKAAIIEHYTAEVHRLYLAVLEQSDARLEILPLEFFHELGRQFSDDMYLILAYQGERVVGFACGLRSRPTATPLFVGIDYEFNRQGDVYFNLMFQTLGQICEDGATHVRFGADSDEFKGRLGCRQQRHYVFVRATNWLQWPLSKFAETLFPPVSLREPQHVFRAAADTKTAGNSTKSSRSALPEP